MQMTNRQPDPGSVRAGTGLISHFPVKSHNAEEVMSAYCRMLYIIGSYASLVQGKVKDLCAELEQNPGIYRQEVKRDTKAAMRACEGMVRHIGSLAAADRQYEDWLDITDRMESNVETDIMKLYFTIDNAVHRRHHEPHRVASLLILAVNLAHQMETVVRDCAQVLHEISPRLIMTGGLGSSAAGVRSRLQEVMWRLVPLDVFRECKGDIFVRLGFDIIYKKMANLELLEDRAVEQAMLYGVAFRKEDQKPGCNNGKAWLEFHDKVLYNSYGMEPDGQVAGWLGRSVAAIRARARILGLKKGQSTEERLQIVRNNRKKINNN